MVLWVAELVVLHNHTLCTRRQYLVGTALDVLAVAMQPMHGIGRRRG